jgi:hypothetical protein
VKSSWAGAKRLILLGEMLRQNHGLLYRANPGRAAYFLGGANYTLTVLSSIDIFDFLPFMFLKNRNE